jgi:hypoxanthine-guanine phosphoribosyltransferase
MSEGFSEEKIDVAINKDEVKKLLKNYKKIKKYMRSPLFAVKTMDGTETFVSDLLKEVDG